LLIKGALAWIGLRCRLMAPTFDVGPSLGAQRFLGQPRSPAPGPRHRSPARFACRHLALRATTRHVLTKLLTNWSELETTTR